MNDTIFKTITLLDLGGFDKIIELVAKHGTLTAIIATAIFVIISFTKANLFTDLVKKLFKKSQKEEVNNTDNEEDSESKVKVRDSDIINHEMFNMVDFWVYSEIPTLTLKTDFRTAVFQRYLHIFFKSYKDILHIFVNGGTYKKMDNAELRKALLKLITDVVFDYETEMKQCRIPDVVISKMKDKNNDTLKLTIDLINSICDSDFYNSEHNLLKVYSFLNIVQSILENTMSHCEDVSNSINGQLSGLKFDGYQEP